MQINFLKRGRYDKSFSNEEFAAYVGQLPDFTKFYLDAAIQAVETAICKSFAQHTLQVETPETIKMLPYGNIKRVKKLERVICNGETQEVSTKWARVVGGKLYLPQTDTSWLVTYTTDSIEIGPMDRLEVFRVGELLINGEYVCPDEIRQNFDHHRSKNYGTHQPKL